MTAMANDLPPDYGDAAAEDAAVRERAGLIDRRDWGVVEATGRDRASFLHALLSNDVKALGPGQGCAATLLDVHGKVQVMLGALADGRVLRGGVTVVGREVVRHRGHSTA